MSRRKKLLSAILIIAGVITLSLALHRLFVQMIMEPGNPAEILATSLGSLVLSTICIVLGAAMWKRLKVPVAEFSLIGGAFSLGIAFRSIGPNANVLGTMGLLAFVMGYLILKSAADRGKQRRTLGRILEKELPPAAEALIAYPEPVSAVSSLYAMRYTLGDSVQPEFDREAALEALRRAS